ncbi:glycosyltransferase family 4 protein [Planctomycetes bacterium K23_9]|uniref:GalNAc-alpha-(1->4)-GalNAc-alpha-(1->3)-diNAcBac-PP-undecaprenol alpha-1,4-N-acetyl-D-galactosaminyltransferase n=1 Tax=Stieleria marina TaxID=1930275 RepID=A0A517NZQ3_9BACT|nr:GalNAc-alpha-(1->4)-GalNAc-alpha-(1->3)-diNAcBac-PP-undecaprenol alpha-1,4-N-acetyl-D-galactosaminyltransferase [Planctomycetes bacterium K23_9]
MKIACIIHSLDGGGAERVMAGLASRLCDRGHEVVLVTLDNGVKNRHELSSAVRRVPLDLMRVSRSQLDRFFNSRRRVAMIRDSLLDQKPDVVLSFCDRTNIDVLSGLRNHSLPIVISERSDPSQQNLGRWWEYRRKSVYRRADRVVALTRSAADHLRPICSCPIDVIASAVEQPPIESDRAAAESNRRILAVGRLEYEKGFDRLLDAFSTVSQQHSQWSLRIVGDGSLRKQLQSQADALGLDDRVTMPGWIKPIWGELADATLFALPSRYEGFPSALLEAMAMGVPSIAMDCESGPRAIVENESNALLIPNDRGELAQGLLRLIEDCQLRNRIAAGAKSVLERFSWDKMVDSYERVLSEAASSVDSGD